MLLDIIDVLQLKRGHAYLPDHFARRRAERNIVGGDDRIGQMGIDLLLRQHLVRKIKVVLVDKTPVKTFSFLVEGIVTVIRQDPVLKGLFHSTN